MGGSGRKAWCVASITLVQLATVSHFGIVLKATIHHDHGPGGHIGGVSGLLLLSLWESHGSLHLSKH